MEPKWMLQDMVYIYIDFYDTLLSENGVTNCELNLCESFYEFRKEK